MKYDVQIKHPLWQKKRLEVLKRESYVCQECESDDKQLHVHHSYYQKGLLLWDYPDDALFCLCAECHKIRA